MQFNVFPRLTPKISVLGALPFMQRLIHRLRPRPACKPSRTAVTADHRAQIGAHFNSHNALETWDSGGYVLPSNVRAHRGRISVNFHGVDGKLKASVEHYRSMAERLLAHQPPVVTTDHDAHSEEAIRSIALLGDC